MPIKLSLLFQRVIFQEGDSEGYCRGNRQGLSAAGGKVAAGQVNLNAQRAR